MDLSALPSRRRSSLRLRGFDYTQPGAYFITVCTHRRETLFGTVVDQIVRPSAEGEIAGRTWLHLPNHYPNCELDAFVVMPNHVHGILILGARVGAGFKPAPTSREEASPEGTVGRWQSLSEMIRGFKTFSARRINELRGTRGKPVWQRGFYEHVIRTDTDLDRIREYIEANPGCWADDDENPNCIVP
jgi:REP element-mobilizing transposase RayT